MKAIVYDTETTGLPIWGSPSEDPAQPRVTQLCAELIDLDTRKVLSAMHTIIKPDGWTIPPEVAELTGITTELALAIGIPMAAVLPAFIHMWMRAGERIGHNESFDMRMIRIELMRDPIFKDMTHPTPSGEIPFADFWKGGQAFCTQAQSQKIVNLPPTEKMKAARRNGPKPPNLGEAYLHFTGTPLDGAHDATVDVFACKTVYFGIRAAQQKQALAA